MRTGGLADRRSGPRLLDRRHLQHRLPDRRRLPDDVQRSQRLRRVPRGHRHDAVGAPVAGLLDLSRGPRPGHRLRALPTPARVRSSSSARPLAGFPTKNALRCDLQRRHQRCVRREVRHVADRRRLARCSRPISAAADYEYAWDVAVDAAGRDARGRRRAVDRLSAREPDLDRIRLPSDVRRRR